MKIAVWSPLPPAGSGIADYVHEQLPPLRARHEIVTVAPGDRAPDADLHVYHLGNSPEHGYVYQAAIARPGVAVMHEWNLHHLVLHETLEAGDRALYLREMRRAWGERGTFVGRQIARGLGGDLLPALHALNDRVLQNSLAVVALTSATARRARARLQGRPVLHLPHHAVIPVDPVPTRAEARAALGLARDAFVVCAPGLATRHKRLDAAWRALRTLRAREPRIQMIVAGGVDPAFEGFAPEDGLTVTGRLSLDDFVRHLAAADVVLCLRFPSYGETSGALLRSMALGRPVLVTGATPMAEDMPEGTVVPIDPGAHEDADLVAMLGRLLDDPGLAERIGRAAQAHARAAHALDATAASLAAFLSEVKAREGEWRAHLEARRAPEGSLLGFLTDEVRFAAVDLGLPGLPPEVDGVLTGLTGVSPR